MKKQSFLVLVLLITFSLFNNIVSNVKAETVHTAKFDLITSKGYFELNINISDTLYQYYRAKSHVYSSYSELDKFVTPYVFTSLANLLYSIVSNEEEYVNTALMLVHQITYSESSVKYPVETLVDGIGDCDLTSYLLASILYQAGFDTILLIYENLPETTLKHMNVGVHLSVTPQNTRQEPWYVVVNNKTYYPAETTGENWQDGWRVGEFDSSLENANITAVYLLDYETSSVDIVHPYFDTALLNSTLSVTVVPIPSYVVIFGQLNPPLSNETISVFSDYKLQGVEYLLGQTKTTADGSFTFSYIPILELDICNIRVSWAGNDEYRGVITSGNFFSLESFLVVPFYVVIITFMSILVGKSRLKR